jgi:hypothetical protein
MNLTAYRGSLVSREYASIAKRKKEEAAAGKESRIDMRVLFYY